MSLDIEKENSFAVFTNSVKQELELGSFKRISTTAKKCTKKRDARAKLLFCQSKLIAFLPFSLPSLLLKLPNVVIQKGCYHCNVTSNFSSLFSPSVCANLKCYQLNAVFLKGLC